MSNLGKTTLNRRGFIKLAGATGSAAALVACAQPASKQTERPAALLATGVPPAISPAPKAIKIAYEDVESKRTIWRERWQGLDVAMRKQVDLLTKDFVDNPTMGALFVRLIEDLREFSTRLFGEFLKNMADTPPEYYTHEFALNSIIDQVGFDIATISQAASQRRVYADVLGDLDRIADAHVQQAVNMGVFHTSASHIVSPSDHREARPLVLTYFQRSPTWRANIYSPITLIGVPYDSVPAAALTNSKTLLGMSTIAAVAREVGQLVFWKGFCPRYPGDATFGGAKFLSCLNRRMQGDGISEWVANGVSQLVADVFAVMVSGESISSRSMDNAIARQFERYYAEDQRYQFIPALRTEAILTTLSLNKSVTPVRLAELQRTWQTRLTDAFGHEVSTLQGSKRPPLTVLPSGYNAKLSYRAANEEINHAVTLIHSIFAAGISQSKLIPITPLDMKLPLNKWEGETGNTTWNGLKAVLLDEERTQFKHDQLTGLREEDDVPHDWQTLLYAGGWVMESGGNGGGMP